MSKIKSKFKCSAVGGVKEDVQKVLKAFGRDFQVAAPFSLELIPRTKMNKAYFIRINELSNLGVEACPLELEINFDILLYFVGGTDENKTYDVALSDAEGLIGLLAGPEVAYSYPSMAGLFFNNVNIEPLSSDNENVLVIRMNFDAKIFINYLE